jgi:hypothetical protein
MAATIHISHQFLKENVACKDGFLVVSNLGEEFGAVTFRRFDWPKGIEGIAFKNCKKLQRIEYLPEFLIKTITFTDCTFMPKLTFRNCPNMKVDMKLDNTSGTLRFIHFEQVIFPCCCLEFHDPHCKIMRVVGANKYTNFHFTGAVRKMKKSSLRYYTEKNMFDPKVRHRDAVKAYHEAKQKTTTQPEIQVEEL